MQSSLLGLIVALAGACGVSRDGARPVALEGDSPSGVRASCAVAGRRCSRCHSIERVEHARIREPDEWRDYVHRMRLMPSSGIPPQEEAVIVECLVFRTSGQRGLDILAAGMVR